MAISLSRNQKVPVNPEAWEEIVASFELLLNEITKSGSKTVHVFFAVPITIAFEMGKLVVSQNYNLFIYHYQPNNNNPGVVSKAFYQIWPPNGNFYGASWSYPSN